MSRYTLTVPNAPLEIVCGFDQPLDTFFAIVSDYTVPLEQDHIIFWIGVTPHAITTVEQLQELVSGYVTIPESIVTKLRWDWAHRKPLTPLQETMLGLIMRRCARPSLIYRECMCEISHAWAEWHGVDDLSAYRWYVAVVA
jgi:hypothetical protein